MTLRTFRTAFVTALVGIVAAALAALFALPRSAVAAQDAYVANAHCCDSSGFPLGTATVSQYNVTADGMLAPKMN
jgi:hypothetical protein